MNPLSTHQAKQIGDAYLRERVLNASKPELTLMSYDGVLRFLHRAMALASEQPGDYQRKIALVAELNEAIARAQALISDLNASLNPEAGEDDKERVQVKAMADSLRAQYFYLNHHLGMALARRNPLMLQQAIAIVQNWRDGWAGAMENLGLRSSSEPNS